MSTDELRVAVDLGASSGRVLAGRLDRGRLTTTEVARFANVPVAVPRVGGRRPGEDASRGTTLHWDLLRLWEGVQDGLRSASRAGDVRSVGIDSWAVDYGLLDADGDLLGNPVHYRDTRTEGAVSTFHALADAAAHYARTGLQVQPFNTVFQLVAAARDARTAQARRLLLVPDLLTAWLTGREVAEVTNASTTGLLDVRSRTWSTEVLHDLRRVSGLDARPLLAELVEPGTVVGEVTAGLGADGADGASGGGVQAIAVGSHDTASAVAAVPMTSDGAAYISSGTWSLVGLELDAPVLTEASRTANFTNELGVDGTVRYLKNVPALWLLQESLRTWKKAGADHDLDALLSAAADVPPLRALVDVDDPSLVAPGDMPGRLRELVARDGGLVPDDGPTVVRTVLESVALAYRRAVRQASELAGRRIDVVHVVGGGARNALLCRLTADATGLPVVAGPTEGTALGNLLVQAWAAGDVADLAGIREVVAASTHVVRHEPSASAEKDWDAAERRLDDGRGADGR